MKLYEVIEPTYIDNSSHIEEIWHDGKDLFVQFLTGAVYKYFGVKENVAKRMIRAHSRGRFMHRHVRGKYKYARIM